MSWAPCALDGCERLVDHQGPHRFRRGLVTTRTIRELERLLARELATAAKELRSVGLAVDLADPADALVGLRSLERVTDLLRDELRSWSIALEAQDPLE